MAYPTLNMHWGSTHCPKPFLTVWSIACELLLAVAIGLTGLVVFIVAAKRYVQIQSERFRQYVVEEIYDRYITQTIESTDECSSDHNSDINNCPFDNVLT